MTKNHTCYPSEPATDIQSTKSHVTWLQHKYLVSLHQFRCMGKLFVCLLGVQPVDEDNPSQPSAQSEWPHIKDFLLSDRCALVHHWPDVEHAWCRYRHRWQRVDPTGSAQTIMQSEKHFYLQNFPFNKLKSFERQASCFTHWPLQVWECADLALTRRKTQKQEL